MNLTAIGVNDPVTASTPANLANGLIRQDFPVGFPTVVRTVPEGEELFARYDQLMPHYLVEEAIRSSFNNPVASSYARACIILVNNGGAWSVYHVQSILDWTVQAPIAPNRIRISAPRGRVICVGAALKPEAPQKAPRWKKVLDLVNDEDDDEDGDLDLLMSGLHIAVNASVSVADNSSAPAPVTTTA
jgi:hypothetical protein